MPFDKTHWSWMNGRIVPWTDSKVHISSHALHYGTGIFEGIRSYMTPQGPAVFRMDAHLDRFFRSAATYRLDVRYTKQQIEDAVCEVIRRNDFQECYIRPLCYYGSESLGLRGQNPTEIAVLAWSGIAHVSAHTREHGARMTVSPYLKLDSRMIPTTAKATGQYLNSFLATREAMDRGFDEAVLLNADGTVGEAAVANVFIVKDGCVRTNDEKSNILLGITRDTAIQLAKSLGYKMEIGPFRLDDMRIADEVFVTGTAAEIVPFSEIDGTKIGSGKPGPVAEAIRVAFDRAKTGQDAAWKHWLYHVTPATVAV
jgi:branched-chain amino acid aminotransferase